MKIVDIESIPIEVPRQQRPRVQSSYSALPSARFVVAVVKTDDGVEGIGEASPEYQWTGEDDRTCHNAIVNYLAPALKGHDPLRIQAAFDRMDFVISHN